MQQAPSHRILLAEEQAVSRDLVVLVLGKLGYRIETVTTARDLLQRVGARPPSLLLLSSTLADRAGAKLLNQIRAGSSGDCLPVAMIGPQIDERSGEAYLRRGDRLPQPADRHRAPAAGGRARGSQPAARAIDRAPMPSPSSTSTICPASPTATCSWKASFWPCSCRPVGVYLERMREALGTGQSWTGSAHALKGASANLGARRVTGLALVAERSQPDAAQLEALRAAVEEVRAFGLTRTG